MEMKKADLGKLQKENALLKERIKELENLFKDKTASPAPVPREQLYDALMHMSPAAITITNLDNGSIYAVSDKFSEQSGFSKEEIIGKTVFDLGLWVEPEKRQAFKEVLARDGLCFNMEVRHRRKDGAVMDCLDSAALIRIGDERCIIGLVLDDTDRKKAEEALQNERDFSMKIMDSLPGLFYIFDEQGHFLLWNKNHSVITGYSDEEIRQLMAVDQIAESDRNLILETMKYIFQTGEASVEADIVCKDGSVKSFLLSGTRIQYGGRPCLLGTGIDITDKKKAVNELKLFAKSLEEANVAMRVFMNRKDEDQRNMEEKLQANVNHLVVPYLKMLKQAGLEDRYQKYLNILENNFREVLSPFMGNMLSSYKSLTPHELQIVDLIQKGKGTKEIADMLNASVNTIASHRTNIRKKLGLINSKINLRSHILSLK